MGLLHVDEAGGLCQLTTCGYEPTLHIYVFLAGIRMQVTDEPFGFSSLYEAVCDTSTLFIDEIFKLVGYLSLSLLLTRSRGMLAWRGSSRDENQLTTAGLPTSRGHELKHAMLTSTIQT